MRVDDWTTQWAYRDVVTVVEGAGPSLDCSADPGLFPRTGRLRARVPVTAMLVLNKYLLNAAIPIE